MSNRFTITILSLLVGGLAFTSAFAAPTGYSINSDSGTSNADSLYRIDLETGNQTRIGTVQAFGIIRLDVEGLAFAPDGTLYGLDDDRRSLFPIDPVSGNVYSSSEVMIANLPIGGMNDVGMTFACDENLYVTSVVKQNIFRLDLNGNLVQIGVDKALGVNISAIAAYGNPVKMYGLGNGQDKDGVDLFPNLYEIDLTTGQANVIGALGNGVKDYNEAGLAFDDEGQLWAITDRRLLGNQGSRIIRINTNDGAGTHVATTQEVGFESLAVTVPRGCQPNGNGEIAHFKVQKIFTDLNDELSSTLRIRCNGGDQLEQEITVQPNEAPLGKAEVTFNVSGFQEGVTDCQVYEDEPEFYDANYECFSNGSCSSTATDCSFEDISSENEHLCVIHNTPSPVEITVTKQWEFVRDEATLDYPAEVSLICKNVFDGDGVFPGNGNMEWRWLFENPLDSKIAMVQPRFDDTTECYTEEYNILSAVEASTDCPPGTVIKLGDGQRVCTVTNTVFFEGIPTLNQWGMILFALSMLSVGLAAIRRI